MMKPARFLIRRPGGSLAFALPRLAAALALAAGLWAAPALSQGAHLAIGEGRLVRVSNGEAATVFVADPEIADVQVPAHNAVLVMGRRAGSTTLYVLDADGGPLLQQRIDVRHNIEALQGVLRQRFPNLRVSIESAPGSLLIGGGVPDAQTADAITRTVLPYLGENDQLINQLAVASPTQVHLRVRVTEVSRAVTQQLGVNWSVIASPGNFTTGLISGRPFESLINTFTESSGSSADLTALLAGALGASIANSVVNGAGSSSANVNADAAYNASRAWSSGSSRSNSFSRVTSYSASPNGGYSFLGGYSHNGNSVQAMIDVLDREGLISILAEPNLTAVSGQTASFLAGGEFPIPVKQDGDSISVEFKPFGVALDFTPTVMADDRISIKVRPEISELDPNSSIVMEGMAIPGLSVRRVETTVEMASGQSFAIGGLLQNNVRDVLSQVPGLGSLPVLGKLFSSTDYQNNKSELVVIVTPYLVRPTDSSRLATPLDSMRPATDIEYILHDKIGLDPLEGTVPRLTGQAGFVY